jgi:hypothetical protein
MANTQSINAGAGIDPELLDDAPAEQPSVDLAAMQEQINALLAQNRALMEERKAIAGEGHDDTASASSKESFGIIIDEGSNPNDPSEVPVQVNGRAYQIRRGSYVEVPKEVISVLNDAVTDKTIPQFDAAGMPNGVKVRPSRRYPFREFGLVIDAAGKRVQAPQPTNGE